MGTSTSEFITIKRGPNKKIVRRGGCDKKPYRSRAAAMKWVKTHTHQKTAYKCKSCGQWHTSSWKHGEYDEQKND